MQYFQPCFSSKVRPICLSVSKITLIILGQNFMDFGDNVEQSQRKTHLVLA